MWVAFGKAVTKTEILQFMYKTILDSESTDQTIYSKYSTEIEYNL